MRTTATSHCIISRVLVYCMGTDCRNSYGSNSEGRQERADSRRYTPKSNTWESATHYIMTDNRKSSRDSARLKGGGSERRATPSKDPVRRGGVGGGYALQREGEYILHWMYAGSELPRHIQHKCQASNGKWVRQEALGEKGIHRTKTAKKQMKVGQKLSRLSSLHLAEKPKSTGRDRAERGSRKSRIAHGNVEAQSKRKLLPRPTAFRASSRNSYQKA